MEVDDDEMHYGTVDIRDERGNLVRSYTASKQEIELLPTLMEARKNIEQNQPMEALEKVLHVVRQTKGEEGVMKALDETKASYEAQVQFEKMNLAGLGSQRENTKTKSILGQQLNGKQVLIDATQDGSTIICEYCRAMIARKRFESHITTWCPVLYSEM